jgi:CRISPR-associated endonuclease/helicase Cas3
LPNPFQLVVMSATPPVELKRIFQDESDESRLPDHPLGRRQLASKPARLVVADKAKAGKANRELAKVLAAEAAGLVGDTAAEATCAPAIGVFCNRVDTARRTYERLMEKFGGNVALLTGRMRPFDKDDLLTQQLDRLAAQHAAERCLAAPLFVVATQTLEVGADLDFDGLVTEAGSLDALRQRFGRLNRMGRPIDAKAVIVARADQTTASGDDPVYGAALANTWAKLSEWGGADKTVDFGIAALAPRVENFAKGELEELNAPTGHAPVMLPAHIDAWVQTAPEPVPTPDVALFLHGPRSGPADVQVGWRADLTGEGMQAWVDAVRLCPPASPETLAVPIGQLRRWLESDEVAAGSDVEGTDQEVPDAGGKTEQVSGQKRRVVRWRGRDDVGVVSRPNEVRPGDVIVIPARYGGWDVLGALGSDAPIADWGDRASMEVRDKAILRLHPDVLDQWPQAASLMRFAKDITETFDEDPEIYVAALKDALSEIAGDPETPDWLRRAAAHFSAQKHLDRLMLPHPAQGWVLQGRQRLGREAVEVDSFSDEDDPTASGTSSRELDDHRAGVANYAARFARGCGLPEGVAGIVESGGLYHDLGKADPRFQAWLKGGNPWAGGPLLAKSTDMPQGPKESEAARKRARYPKGGRHELVSVRLLESRPDLLPRDSNLRDLLLQLVGGHHGYCRPFAPVVDDGESQPVSHDGFTVATTATGLERLDSGVADRFWGLTRRYGWWGLAWLEAIMRLADHRRSEAEERGG